MKERKAFNFYKSYWETGLMLPEKERLQFYEAIFMKQFLNKDTVLDGMAAFAYKSQQHSIDSQLKGFLDIGKRWKSDDKNTPKVAPKVGGKVAPKVQVQVQVQEQEQEQVQEQEFFTHSASFGVIQKTHGLSDDGLQELKELFWAVNYDGVEKTKNINEIRSHFNSWLKYNVQEKHKIINQNKRGQFSDTGW